MPLRFARRLRDCVVAPIAVRLGRGRLGSRVPAWARRAAVGFSAAAGLSLGLLLLLLLVASSGAPALLERTVPARPSAPLAAERTDGPLDPLSPGSRLPPLVGEWLNGPPPARLPAAHGLTVVDVWAGG